MQNIIVGVDRSETARRAAEVAARHAKANQANLHIVTSTKVRQSREFTVAGDRWFLDEIGDTRAFLDDLARQLDVTDVTSSICVEDPATALCAEARRLDAELVVVGNRRVQGVARVLGAVAGDVLKKAPCDVLVAHTNAAN